MKIKNLVVADIIDPLCITNHWEDSIILQNRICEKVNIKDSNYKDLKTGKIHGTKTKIGITRIDKTSIVPLSDYYYSIGLKKKNSHDNKKEVYQKVKQLKKERKI